MKAVALVTGGARGIGAAIAVRLRAEGATVVIADRAPVEDGPAVDVTDPDAVEELVAEVIARYGRIDVLVNNAGVFSSLVPTPYRDLTLEDWRRLYEVNVYGVFTCCRAVLAPMEAARSGRIVNVASAAPLKGLPGFLHYTTSKGAVLAMTRCLAREVAHAGVNVNAVAPGFTHSAAVLANDVLVRALDESTLASRAIEREEHPSDVADVVAFLAGPDARFMTGQTLVVDGGTVLV